MVTTYPCGKPDLPSFASHWRYLPRRLDGTTAGRVISPFLPCVCHPKIKDDRAHAGSGPSRVRRRLFVACLGEHLWPPKDLQFSQMILSILCRGRRFQTSGHSDFEILSNFGESSNFTVVKADTASAACQPQHDFCCCHL